MPGRASQACRYSLGVPEETTNRCAAITTQQQPVRSGRCRPQRGTFRFCPRRGARCISAEILGCLPSPSLELTSASATGMLLSKSPVLPRWQKPWIIASSAWDPGMKGPQRPRSSKGDGRDRLAEAWCECLLPLGGTVSQRMPAEPPSLLATLTNCYSSSPR